MTTTTPQCPWGTTGCDDLALGDKCPACFRKAQVPEFHGLRVDGLLGQPGDGARTIKGGDVVPLGEVDAYSEALQREYPGIEIRVSEHPRLLKFTDTSDVRHGIAVLTEIGARGQAGWARKPYEVYVSPSSLWMDWACRELVADKNAMARLLEIQQVLRVGVALADEARGWVKGQTTHWADNSVTTTYTAKDGGRKEVTEVGPHGDLCY